MGCKWGGMVVVSIVIFFFSVGVCFGDTEKCNGFNSWREGCGY